MRYLLDTSVVHRLADTAVLQRVRDLPEGGRYTCTPVVLEVGFSARTAVDHQGRVGRLMTGMQWLPMTEQIERRAIEVQGLLADRGQHRSARLADLLIAAIAEAHGATVLHYDADFDQIAAVTGQPCQWVVTRGSVS